MIRLCRILWLMVRSRDGVTGAAIIHPWDPVGLGAAILVVIKLLTASIWWVVFTSVKQLRKCASDSIIWVLHRGATAEAMRGTGGVCPEEAHRVLLSQTGLLALQRYPLPTPPDHSGPAPALRLTILASSGSPAPNTCPLLSLFSTQKLEDPSLKTILTMVFN